MSVKDIQGESTLDPKRIVLYSSCKIREEAVITIFNYIQNCFYNTQWHIDNPIPIKIIPYYKAKGPSEKDDYPIDIGAFLERSSLNIKSFLDF